MAQMPAVDIACRAKINLALSVGLPEAPGGLHPIASLMLAIDFADDLRLERVAGDRSDFSIAFVPGGLPGRPAPAVDWPLEKDLAYRAHGLLQEYVVRSLPVRAVLRKRVPAGAGLGGGSADAAGMLVGLRSLFDLDVSDQALLDLSAKLGSDVIFQTWAALGRPAGIVTGFGDRIEPVRMSPPLDLVLILPPFGCPTGAVYQAFDRLAHAAARPAVVDLPRVRALAQSSPVNADAPFNDLAQPACIVRPELARIREQLQADLRLPVHVTGSGSTLFVLATDQVQAIAIADRITTGHHLQAVVTRTMDG